MADVDIRLRQIFVETKPAPRRVKVIAVTFRSIYVEVVDGPGSGEQLVLPRQKLADTSRWTLEADR